MLASRSAAVTRPWPTRNTEQPARSVACSAPDRSSMAGTPHYPSQVREQTGRQLYTDGQSRPDGLCPRDGHQCRHPAGPCPTALNGEGHADLPNGVAQAHINASLRMFDRSSMAVFAYTTLPFHCQSEPNVGYVRVVRPLMRRGCW